MREPMKVVIAYDGSKFADAAIDDLPRAGLPRDSEALVASVPELSAGSPAISDYALLSSEAGRIKAVLEREKRAYQKTRAGSSKAARRLRRQFPEW